MLPSIGDAKVDKFLSQFSQKYVNDSYISERIFPVLGVKEKTGLYAKYGTENLRIQTKGIQRAPGTRAVGIDYTVSRGNYSCTEKSVEKLVPDEMKNNTDAPFDPNRDAVMTCMDTIWLNQEWLTAQALGDSSIVTNYVDLTSGANVQWSDYEASDPIADIETGIATMLNSTGRRPNTCFMGYDVFAKLKYHPDIREQVKYNVPNAAVSDADLVDFLKAFFNFKNVFVGTAVADTAVEGQSPTLGQIWTKNFWLEYQTDRATLMQATAGYTFFDVPRITDTYREEPLKSDVVRCRYSYDTNLMDTNLLYLVKKAIA